MSARFGNRMVIAASASALLMLLVGCAGATPGEAPSVPAPAPSADTPAESPAEAVDTSSVIDPLWPWPGHLPRPAHPISSEYTGPNVAGEGGLYSLEFTAPSMDAVQAYADALADAGIVWMLDGVFAPDASDETELSVVAMGEGYMTSLTVDTDTMHTVFSFMGTLP